MEEITRNYTDVYAPRQSGIDLQAEDAGNWISDLFTPTFACTVEDISEGKSQDVEVERKIKRVPAFDPEAIQQVYHKVRLMNLMDKEVQKLNLKHASVSGMKFEAVTDELLQNQSNIQNMIPSLVVEECTAEGSDDLENSIIWDSEELAVLRKVFKSAKSQISDLKVKLRETEDRNKYLDDIVKKQEHAIEKMDTKLSEATKANKRLKIHCDNLQYQLDHNGAKLDTVTDMWKEIDGEKSKIMKQIQEVRVAHDKERLVRENLELKLENVIHEKQREVDFAVQNTKIQYEKQIFDLCKEKNKLADEFTKEKQTFGVTSKALNHLRRHFASLPVENIMPPNAVYKDEVPHINHVS